MNRFNPRTLYSNLIGEWNFTREVDGSSPTLTLLRSRDNDFKKRPPERNPLSFRGRAVLLPIILSFIIERTQGSLYRIEPLSQVIESTSTSSMPMPFGCTFSKMANCGESSSSSFDADGGMMTRCTPLRH